MSLVPLGNVFVCPSDPIFLTCVTTEGTLVWVTATGNQVFNGPQSPTTEGNFTLVVNSFEQRVEGTRVNSTASVRNFQPTLDGISINCTESSTGLSEGAVLRVAGKCCVCACDMHFISVLFCCCYV